MRLKLFCEVKEAIGKDQPQGVTREYSGWGHGMFFAVYRPTGETGECGESSPDWNEKDLTLYMGFYEKEEDVAMKPGESKEIQMETVRVLKVIKAKGEEVETENWEHKKIKAQDFRTLTIESEKGTFYLPDPYTRKGETNTFNGKPITCWS